jgi:hypothetical protein
MKLSQSRRGFLAVVIAGACLLPINSYAANIIVGAGNDTSYLVLQSSNLGVRTYEVRYTAANGPYNARFLFDQAIAEDPSLTVSFGQFGTFGTPPVPNYFVNSINGESSLTDYWAHWVSGGSGFQGPPPDFNFDPGTPTLGTWTLGYGISTHTLAPGSWDALFLSNGATQPSVVPIPEPSVVVTALLGSFVLFARRRRTS